MHGVGVAAILNNVLSDSFRRALLDVKQANAGSTPCESLGDGKSDPTARPGNYRQLTVKAEQVVGVIRTFQGTSPLLKPQFPLQAVPIVKDPLGEGPDSLLGLRRLRPFQYGKSFLGIRVVGIQLERGVQLCLGLFDLARPAVKKSQVSVQVSALGTAAAELDRLCHQLYRLRPVLSIGCFEGEVPQFLDPVRDLLILLQGIEAVLILLRLRVPQLLQSLGQTVEGLGVVGIGFERQLPVFHRAGRVAFALQVLPQQELGIRVAGLKLDQLFEKLLRAFQGAELTLGEGQEIEGFGRVRLESQRGL